MEFPAPEPTGHRTNATLQSWAIEVYYNVIIYAIIREKQEKIHFRSIGKCRFFRFAENSRKGSEIFENSNVWT